MERFLLRIAYRHGIALIIALFFITIFLLMFIPVLIFSGWREAVVIGLLWAMIYLIGLLWSMKNE